MVRDVSHLLFDRNKADLTRLMPVFDNAGIDARYSCVPLEWYMEPHGWVERSKLFVEHAVDLLCEAARNASSRPDSTPGDIDAVVAVSTTGIATPSLDALVIERLGLRRDVRRLPIFGLGCAGGVIGPGARRRSRARPCRARTCFTSWWNSARSRSARAITPRATSWPRRCSAMAPLRP